MCECAGTMRSADSDDDDDATETEAEAERQSERQWESSVKRCADATVCVCVGVCGKPWLAGNIEYGNIAL